MDRRLQLLVRLVAVTAMGASIAVAAETYRYDRLHRLVRAAYADGTVVAYQYDAAGNRTQRICAQRGDLSGNGSIGLEDIDIFVAVLLGNDTSPYHVLAADLDGSGQVDGRDIQLFVNALLGS